MIKRIIAVLFLGSLALGSGCEARQNPVPDRLIPDQHASGDHQAGLYGAILPKALQVVVEGPQEPGLLGGKGSRRVVAGVTVRFAVEDPDSGTFFAENDQPIIEVPTNAAGTASAVLKLGTRPGDIIVTASLPGHPEVDAVDFRVSTGVERIGSNLESTTGGLIEDFGVRLLDADGTPATGVNVYFRVEGDAKGSTLKKRRVSTDAEGLALNSWRMGSAVQQYFASVEIRDTRPDVPPEQRLNVRALEFEATAINGTHIAIVLFGGLAVFIFGMKLMSDGLRSMADRRLRDVLQFMTRNRIMAVGAGTLMTAMVQSSSATTVMTVGFVNAGLINLTQAIGVVFGANIGTTVTAQIIAFKLEDMAYPAIAGGLLLAALARKPQWRFFGQAVLGFGLLFLGMDTMSGVLKPLSHSPEFVSWFNTFDCTPGPSGIVPPGAAFMCIVIGTLTTLVVQSSSATVGLVLALASQGLVSFYTAVPLILGDNIGTTITANLAAIGTNRNARRTALAHTLFNVFGASYMYFLLFLPLWNGQPVFLGFISAITPGNVFGPEQENLLRHVANSHTAFNVINCLLFLPFTGLLARACFRIIPYTEADKDTVLQYLEPKLLETPSIALQQAVREIMFMIKQGQKSVNEACSMLCNEQKGLEKKILEREEVIDRLQHEITEYLVALSRTNLTPEESELIPALIHAVNDAERLGDHAEAILELYERLQGAGYAISDFGLRDLNRFKEEINEQFQVIYGIFERKEPKDSKKAFQVQRNLSKMMVDFTASHVDRLEKGVCHVQAGVVFLDALNHLDRVGDHLTNIAERAGAMVAVTDA